MRRETFEFDRSEDFVATPRTGWAYERVGKPAFDVVVCLLLFPVLVVVSLVLLVINPVFNRGPLFYMQPRMGRNCAAFTAIKFRTMTPVSRVTRCADDPLEHERVTPLGRFLRASWIDELPQIINVMRGEMSLIGPRPDYFHHARCYVRSIPGYRRRHDVRPGISGLAQIELGYVDSIEGTRAKVAIDLRYLEQMGPGLDLYVFWRTLGAVLRKLC